MNPPMLQAIVLHTSSACFLIFFISSAVSRNLSFGLKSLVVLLHRSCQILRKGSLEKARFGARGCPSLGESMALKPCPVRVANKEK